MEITGFSPNAFDNIASQEDMDMVLAALMPLFTNAGMTTEEATSFMFPSKDSEPIN
jgi:hypothetical protein